LCKAEKAGDPACWFGSPLLVIANRADLLVNQDSLEWSEGSHDDTFVKTDFREVAEYIGAKMFEEKLIQNCGVMIFRK